MIKKMKDYQEQTKRLYPVPETVQQLFPIYKISEDGVFLLESRPEGEEALYDKAYIFEDTNFVTMDDYEKDDFLRRYCLILNSMNVSFKIILINNNQDMEQVARDVYIKKRPGQYEDMVESFNKYIRDRIKEGHSGLTQVKVFVISVRRKDVESARDYFNSIEANLQINFEKMESKLIPMDATARMKALYSYWHMGENRKLELDFKQMVRGNRDWKDYIAPQNVGYYENEMGARDYNALQIGGRYSEVLYLPAMPPGVNPEIMSRLTAGSFPCTITIDVAAIPMDAVRKRLSDLYLQIGRTIEKQQETRNKAGAWSSDVSYDIRRQKSEVEETMDTVNDNNERMFYVGVYAVINGSSRKELENNVTTFTAAAEGEGFHFMPAYLHQLDAFNTGSPVGARFSANMYMYPMLTQPLAGFTPFTIHELYQAGGIAYGINQVSHNILIGDRKTLQNGNGFILGASGSGKSMETKKEITEIFLTTDDDIIVIDPTNEYRVICEYFGGQFIDFSSTSKNYINPLDTDTLQYMDSQSTFYRDKTNLMLSIFAQIKDNNIDPEDNSIIGRVVQKVYEGLGDKNFKVPTLLDFYNILQSQEEIRAQALALAMELFVTGAMNMFSKPTNVNIKNRFTAYGMADIDRSQSGMGIIIMLESIRSRIAQNKAKGKCTWVFIDEFHNLSHNPYSAAYLEKIWREVRKMGGLCTGITQNVGDLLTTASVSSMLANSEFLMLLNLKESEREALEEDLGISSNLIQFISTSTPGCGLLKFGNKIIPCDGRLPKDSVMYNLFNTNFHELAMKIRKKGVFSEVKNPKDLYRADKSE